MARKTEKGGKFRNQEILTHGDTIMNVGDILVILTDEANLPRIKQEIEAKSSITNLKQSF